MPARAKYPLRQMLVGEVVAIKERRKLMFYVHSRGGALGYRFQTKRIGDERLVKRIA